MAAGNQHPPPLSPHEEGEKSNYKTLFLNVLKPNLNSITKAPKDPYHRPPIGSYQAAVGHSPPPSHDGANHKLVFGTINYPKFYSEIPYGKDGTVIVPKSYISALTDLPSPDCSPLHKSASPNPLLQSKIDKVYNNYNSLKPVKITNGKASVMFSKSEKETLIGKLQYVLIGKFTHGRPKFAIIKAFFKNLNLKGDYNLSLFDSRHLFVECFDFDDYVRIWLNVSWYIDGCPMRIFKWTADFHPSKESALAPVWINLPGLPLFMFEEEALLSLAIAVGRPLKIDLNTLNRVNLASARICVEMEVSNTFVTDILVQFVDDMNTNLVEGFQQKVVYEHIPEYCMACNHLGHSWKVCKRQLPIMDDRNNFESEGAPCESEGTGMFVGRFSGPHNEVQQGSKENDAKQGVGEHAGTAGDAGTAMNSVAGNFSEPTGTVEEVVAAGENIAVEFDVGDMAGGLVIAGLQTTALAVQGVQSDGATKGNATDHTATLEVQGVFEAVAPSGSDHVAEDTAEQVGDADADPVASDGSSVQQILELGITTESVVNGKEEIMEQQTDTGTVANVRDEAEPSETAGKTATEVLFARDAGLETDVDTGADSVPEDAAKVVAEARAEAESHGTAAESVRDCGNMEVQIEKKNMGIHSVLFVAETRSNRVTGNATVHSLEQAKEHSSSIVGHEQVGKEVGTASCGVLVEEEAQEQSLEEIKRILEENGFKPNQEYNLPSPFISPETKDLVAKYNPVEQDKECDEVVSITIETKEHIVAPSFDSPPSWADQMEEQEQQGTPSNVKKVFHTRLPIDFNPEVEDEKGELMTWSQAIGTSKRILASRSLSPAGRSSKKLTELRKRVDLMKWDDGTGVVIDKDKYDQYREEFFRHTAQIQNEARLKREKRALRTQEVTSDVSKADEQDWTTPKKRGRNRKKK